MIKKLCASEIKLDTGRTHQIRVHLAGHPVIGVDPLYDDSTLRQLELESYKMIEFVHPLTKEVISVSLDD